MKQLILTTWMLILISTNTNAESKTTRYHLTITDAAHHLAEVSVTFPQIGTKTWDVKLPVWRTGRYEILDLGKNIRHFKAQQKEQDIQTHQIDKNTWRLYLKHPGDVTVTYQIYANQLKHRVAHIDESHAFLDASGVFVFAPARREQPLTVSLTVPDSWTSRSGLNATGDHQFKATNYDQLVDSPIESGIHAFTTFEVDNIQYETLIWGEGNHDIDDFNLKAAKLHQVAKALWGDFPYQRYLYMIHSGDGLRGATEHVNSTIMQFDRFGFKNKKTYHRFLATTAHELIHTWNVKAYRPSGIAPYDYDQENYTDLFWMAEGSTSYYDDLFLRRAGIYNESDYLAKLSEDLEKYINHPGRKHRSLSEASYNTWQKENPERNHNANVSIYLHGAMATWFLDYQIRKLSQNKHSFDDVQRALYKDHRNSDKGYRKSDVLAILQDLTGHDFSTLWHDHIDGTKALPINDMLAYYGLTNKENKDPKSWIGLNLSGSKVSTVDHGSPSWDAGLTAGDELIGLNGLRMKSSQWYPAFSHAQQGDELKVLYASGGILKETVISVGKESVEKVKLTSVKKPSRAQQAAFKSWTGHALGQD